MVNLTGLLSVLEAWAILKPLILFVTGMVIYSIFVFSIMNAFGENLLTFSIIKSFCFRI